MTHSYQLSNAILDATYSNAASGTAVIGSVTITYPCRAAFLMAAPANPGVSGQEFPAGGDYVAGGKSMAGLWATAAANGAKTNTGAIAVTDVPAGVTSWWGVGVRDSSGTQINLQNAGLQGGSKPVGQHDSLLIPQNGWQVGES